MEELTERQKFILTLVVHEHLRSALPVASKNLVERYNIDLSSATVRNELSALEEKEFLRQPHPSAGRVPTEEGYRYFVGRLLQQTELPDATRHMISHQFYQTRKDVDEWMRLAASVLAKQSRGASLVTAPHAEQARFKHVELIATRGRQVLMVLVLMGGEIRQRLLTLAEVVQQETLSLTADNLTQVIYGKDVEGLRVIIPTLNGLEADLAAWVLEEMDETDSVAGGEIFVDGLTNVLSEPEFAESEEARRALLVFEERSRLRELLSRTSPASTVGGVQVLIGGEGTWDDLRSCSMVLTRYGMPGFATGTLGVLGPMRMPYGRAISTVRFLSELLSELISDTITE